MSYYFNGKWRVVQYTEDKKKTVPRKAERSEKSVFMVQLRTRSEDLH